MAIFDPTMSEIRALVVADAEGIIRMWSSGAEALFGYRAAYALGRSLELLIPERSREHHRRAFHAAMATGVIEMDEVITPTVHADGPRSTMRVGSDSSRTADESSKQRGHVWLPSTGDCRDLSSRQSTWS
jgi:PAS domain S-box-containing protein